jgi:hypothetical protein
LPFSKAYALTVFPSSVASLELHIVGAENAARRTQAVATVLKMANIAGGKYPEHYEQCAISQTIFNSWLQNPTHIYPQLSSSYDKMFRCSAQGMRLLALMSEILGLEKEAAAGACPDSAAVSALFDEFSVLLRRSSAIFSGMAVSLDTSNAIIVAPAGAMETFWLPSRDGFYALSLWVQFVNVHAPKFEQLGCTPLALKDITGRGQCPIDLNDAALQQEMLRLTTDFPSASMGFSDPCTSACTGNFAYKFNSGHDATGSATAYYNPLGTVVPAENQCTLNTSDVAKATACFPNAPYFGYHPDETQVCDYDPCKVFQGSTNNVVTAETCVNLVQLALGKVAAGVMNISFPQKCIDSFLAGTNVSYTDLDCVRAGCAGDASAFLNGGSQGAYPFSRLALPPFTAGMLCAPLCAAAGYPPAVAACTA